MSASLVKVVRHNWKKKLAAADRTAEFVGDEEVPELPVAESAAQQMERRKQEELKIEPLREHDQKQDQGVTKAYLNTVEMSKDLEGGK